MALVILEPPGTLIKLSENDFQIRQRTWQFYVCVRAHKYARHIQMGPLRIYFHAQCTTCQSTWSPAAESQG